MGNSCIKLQVSSTFFFAHLGMNILQPTNFYAVCLAPAIVFVLLLSGCVFLLIPLHCDC